MIDAKKAVEEAKRYFAEWYPEKKETFRLEEIKFDEEKNYWNITLSFYETTQDNKNSQPYQLYGEQGNRVYKTLFINADDGIIKSMEIRKI